MKRLWGGRTIRYSRLKKFKNKYKTLSFLAQLIAIWYMAVFTATHFTGDTGAYFNDVETVSGTLSAAEDFCEKSNGPPSEYWKNHCKPKNDNSGGGNGPEPGDEDTGEGTDPDNPGQTDEGEVCGDHSNAGCSENQRITDISQSTTSNSVTITWKNPQGNQFSSVSVYRDGALIQENILNGQFEENQLEPSTTYVYELAALMKNGKNDLTRETIEVTTAAAEEGDTATEEPTSTPEDNSPPQQEEESSEAEEPAPRVDTQAPEEVSSVTSDHKGKTLTLTWINPTDEDFKHVNIYLKGVPQSIKNNITTSTIEIDQKPNETATYIIKTVDANGNESPGTQITVEK
jgi:hypothetical protein